MTTPNYNPFAHARDVAHEAVTDDDAKYFYGERLVADTEGVGAWIAGGLKWAASSIARKAWSDIQVTAKFVNYKSQVQLRKVTDKQGTPYLVKALRFKQSMDAFFTIGDLEPLAVEPAAAPDEALPPVHHGPSHIVTDPGATVVLDVFDPADESPESLNLTDESIWISMLSVATDEQLASHPWTTLAGRLNLRNYSRMKATARRTKLLTALQSLSTDAA